MANETVKQENATNVNDGGSEKTFTQAELDQIVQDRLKREREKYGDYDALKEKAERLDKIEEDAKSELQKATERAEKLQSELTEIKHANEIRTIRDKVAQETGVPASLLSGDTEEACNEQAKGILAFKNPDRYPTVKDSGEVTPKVSNDARAEFKQWASEING